MRLGEKVRLTGRIARHHGWRGIVNLLRCYRDLRLEPEQTRGHILYAQIEPTTFCNFRCTQCDNPLFPRERLRHLTLEQFERILDRLPFVVKMSLVGIGETLLNPKIIDMVRLAKRRGILVGFATNGSLLTREKAQALVDAGLDWINVSMDGATAETFERIRLGGKFPVVVDNLRGLTAVIGRRRRPEVSVWFVAMQSNLPELPALVRLVHELGVPKLCVQGVHAWGQDPWRIKLQHERVADGGSVREVLAEAQRTARSLGVAFEFVNIPGAEGRRSCNWPWRACYITVEGFVTPCCIHGTNPSIINFGNLLEQDFDAIWNGAGYQAFRRELKSATPPSICDGCPSYCERLRL